MSQWTQINGQLRLDGIRFDDTPEDNQKQLNSIKQLIGKTCDFHSPEPDWEACTVPCGSEGSLQYSIAENPNICCMDAYTVSITGSLRDFGSGEDLQKVESWFEKIVKGWDLVRQAVLEVDNGESHFVLSAFGFGDKIRVMKWEFPPPA